jgi:predicted ATPase
MFSRESVAFRQFHSIHRHRQRGFLAA